jgi:hypothetical protein
MNTVKVLSCGGTAPALRGGAMSVSLAMMLLLGGCASYHVQRGALIGALSGAALGSGVGYMISDESLLGSDDSGPGGDTSLPKGSSIAVGLAIGVVAGGIVGAMVGHRRDDGFEKRPKSKELLEIEAKEKAERAERAPYVRDL